MPIRPALVALALMGSALPALACGADSACPVGDGRGYRVHLPDGAAGPVGAIVFAHGYKGSAAGVMGNSGLRAMADTLGVALIALDASDDDWKLANAPNGGPIPAEDEMAYVDAVLADAAARHEVDPARVMATGFSAGGMMTWTLACHRAEAFIGFAPLAGTFWAPVPDRCDSGPASVLHFHGTTDRIVPLEGRPIADTRQGSVTGAVRMYADFGGFAPRPPRRIGGAECDMRGNAAGSVLGLCLFEAGHRFETEHIAAAWQLFTAE